MNLNPLGTATAIESEYSSVISQYISYFNELPDAGKKDSWNGRSSFAAVSILVI